jgi:hypothetical protein
VRATVIPGIFASTQVLQVSVSEPAGKSQATLRLRGIGVRGFFGKAIVRGDAADYVKAPTESVIAESSREYALALDATYPGPRRVRGRLDITASEDGRIVLSVPVVLTGVPTLRAVPRSALLDGRGQSVCIEVERTDGRAFEITRIRGDSSLPALNVRLDSRLGSQSHKLYVGLDSGAEGRAREGKLVVKTMVAGAEESEIEIPVLTTGRT